MINNILKIFGYRILKKNMPDPVIDKDNDFMNIYNKCKDYTMTNKYRMYNLYISVKYVIKKGIEGDFVECGVWKGGNAMLIAYTLKNLGINDRKIWLYDTFEGMSEPTKHDYNVANPNFKAFDKWLKLNKKSHNEWSYCPIQDVLDNIFLTGYKNYSIVKGKVEETIPNNIPIKISLLRLDTDWYESTKHELEHLYPLLQKEGVLIIDDYGGWAGSKKATDEYFYKKSILLNRIDASSRTALK